MKVYLLWEKTFSIGEPDSMTLVAVYKNKEKAEAVATDANRFEVADQFEAQFTAYEVFEEEMVE